MMRGGKPAGLLVIDSGEDEPSGPSLGEDESEGDSEPTDAQLNAAKLVAKALDKGDPAMIHRALKLHYDTCQSYGEDEE